MLESVLITHASFPKTCKALHFVWTLCTQASHQSSKTGAQVGQEKLRNTQIIL